MSGVHLGAAFPQLTAFDIRASTYAAPCSSKLFQPGEMGGAVFFEPLRTNGIECRWGSRAERLMLNGWTSAVSEQWQ